MFVKVKIGYMVEEFKTCTERHTETHSQTD